MGVSEPTYTEAELEAFKQENEKGVTFEGRHYTIYEATQRQRKFERSIRKQKSRILVDKATEDTEKLQTDQIRLVRLRQEYARFSKGVDLPMQHERAEVAGFTWKDGKAAERKAKMAEKLEKQENIANIPKETLANATESGTIKTKWDNDLPPRGQVTEEIADDEKLSWVANELKIPLDKATEYVKAVAKFTDAESEYYSEIRRYQRGEPLQFMKESDAKELADSIEAYIQEAPRWNGGTTHRGVSVSDADLGTYIPGKRISAGGSCSWSGTESIAKEFAEHRISHDRPNPVIYHCDTQSKGTGIRHLSVWPEEDEVLCSTESTWEIVRTEVDSDHITHVFVKEV